VTAPGNALRVAFIDQQGDIAGGAEESLALLLRYLPADIEPAVVLFSDGAFARRLRGEGIRVECVTVPALVRNVTRERPGIAGGVLAIGVVFRLVAVLSRLRPDVVYTNTVKAHLLGSVAARLLGIPSIVHYRDLLEGRSRTLVRVVAKHCGSRPIAITKAVRDCYRGDASEAADQPLVIPEPLELSPPDGPQRDRATARSRLGLPPGKTIVAMVGRINRWKGHDRFLRAAALVVAVEPNVHFAIVGEPIFRDADFGAELRGLAVDLAIADNVTFVPWTSDVAEVYAAIDVHCNCSTREPFGRTTIEAAAAGVPSVCFDDGGAAEAMIPGRTGLAVPPGDVSAFSEAILTYVRDEDRRRRDGDEARHFVERFDARLHAQRVAEVIRDVAASRRRSR
jgi:glycosyltransferase involved in cell wall biosynthesis